MKATMVSTIAAITIGYPEGPLSDALEVAVQQSLPRLPGLEGATSLAERMDVYSTAVKVQREQFIALYGDAFGAQSARLLRGASASRAQPVHRAHAAAG
jgi:hypothetical protein